MAKPSLDDAGHLDPARIVGRISWQYEAAERWNDKVEIKQDSKK
jgi:hypothetical protein